jgi:hypothetical protein
LVVEPGTKRERALQRKQELEAAGVQIRGAILIDPTFPMPEMIARRT